ncbi:MAG: DNA mismatch repair protein MutS, partial [Clostridia bacterium]|nr:DNA mismatch repair protein MutS [Clostridia bacterium]
MTNATPMMQQYLDVKAEYQGYILMYRLGDFFECFFEDAVVVSREVELTLTARDCGEGRRAAMCGVPFHKADLYIGKLVEKGYKVAVCEQTEDPAAAQGLVRREV